MNKFWFRWMTVSHFWKWEHGKRIDLNNPYSKDIIKDLNLLWKILNNWSNASSEQKEKLKTEYTEYSFDDNYKKWTIIFNYVNFMIKKELKTLEIKNNFRLLSELIKFRNENDLWHSSVEGPKRDEWLNIWEPIREWNIVELEKLEIELKSIFDKIKEIYQNWYNENEIIELINNSEKWIKRQSAEEVNQFYDNEEEIQWKLKHNDLKLHEAMWATKDISKIHALENTWQMKQSFYEYDLRNWIYKNKEKIEIVIIDDIEEIREKIISLLPRELDQFNINFEEFDNLKELKENFTFTKFRWTNINKKVFYILDNNFFYEKKDTYPGINMWVEFYNFLKENKPEILDKVAVFSSYDKDEIIEKFGEDVKTIPWKWVQYTDSVHISAISEWIKEKMWEEK